MYFYSLKDKLGFTHSIDNTVTTYYLKSSLKFALAHLQEIGKESLNYWERLNCASCPKWSFYQNHLHIDDGIYVSVGHYRDYDRDSKQYRLFPMMKLEVNPNKHHENNILKKLLDFVREYCTSGELTRIDYAIDIPCEPDEVQVFKTRKEKGLYKGTRYYGQRNKHGFCRIYDKQLESNLETSLTRIEHTLEVSGIPSLERFSFISNKNNDNLDYKSLTSTKKALIELALQVKALGGDYDKPLGFLERRRRYEIEPYLTATYTEYEYDLDILDELIAKARTLLCSENMDNESVNKEVFVTDRDGFISLADDAELPFEE